MAPDNHGGCALGSGGLGERLRRGVPLDLGVGSPEIGRQLPVPVQVPGWRPRQAVADPDMHDKQLRILGPGQLSCAADHYLAPTGARIRGEDDRCRASMSLNRASLMA